ncbi:OpgC family protein [Microvirga sp. 2MCAF38]|uniref:OpgC family protein n=1 Tax=Microvirga sp. 2MCAF38 TaxID=3232989 RepID=UPI003F98C4CE
MKTSERITSIDFWRGFVLIAIFVNHIPGNLVENLTPRNYGFSDAAEAFIFISGLSVALVYYPKIAQSGLLDIAKRCLLRSFQLYKVHLLLTAGAIALFSIGYELSDDIGLIEADGRDAVFGNTAKGITGILVLGHQLGYFNILPLYIALMLWAPVALILTRIHATFALAVSFAIYIFARTGTLTLPSWPEPGTWFFNPFAWQLLFTIGIVTGVVFAGHRPRYQHTLFVICVGAVALSFAVMTNALSLTPGLFDNSFEHFDMTKQDLGLGRLLHFLALAYVVTQLRIGRIWERSPVGPDLMRLGRNGLPVFAVGSILSALGQVIMTLTAVKSSASPHMIGMVFTITGVFGLLALARYLEWNKLNSDGLRKSRAKRLGLSSVSPG